LPNSKSFFSPIDIIQTQPQHFASTQPIRCQHEQNRAAAQAKREELLRGAAETRSEEAKRRNRIKAIEEEYERIAAYGAARYHLDSSEIVEMLRQADERPFRLLREAIAFQQGGK